MEGEAQDYIIGDNGELEPVCEEVSEPDIERQTDITALVFLQQTVSGEVTVNIYGTPTDMLMTALIQAIRDIGAPFQQH